MSKLQRRAGENSLAGSHFRSMAVFYRRRLPHYHAAGKSAPLFLSRSDVASLVVEALQYRANVLKHYQLHAWVVMPNHVHLLITPLILVPQLMHSLKRFTAAGANRALNRSGQFAELSPTPEAFSWSSASRPTPSTHSLNVQTPEADLRVCAAGFAKFI